MPAENTFTPRWIAEALGLPSGPASGSSRDAPFTQIETDSRKIKPGCLFVPLKGERFDGHDFIPMALKQGARGVLCEMNRLKTVTSGISKDPPWIFAVDDALKAYRTLAAAWRKQFPIPVIAVAGSAGKTTIKELLTAILRGKWPEVLKTQGSQNGFVGIPMTLLELRVHHGAAVVEVGIDEIGAMKQHIALIAPSGAVLSAVGPEHMEKLLDLPTVAREEGLALELTAASGGAIAISLDDPWVSPHYEQLHSGKRLGYTLGIRTGQDVIQAQIQLGQTLCVNGAGLRNEVFEVPLPGRHNAVNLLAALSVAHLLGVTPTEMRAGLKGFVGPEGRSQLRILQGGIRVLCDYYNSQPPSLAAGLELLAELSKTVPGEKPSRSWACLADMLELGLEEERYHREVAPKIRELGVQNIFLFGRRMRWLEDELKTKGFTGTLRHFETQEEMSRMLSSAVRPNDVVLIKGSHSMKMEEVWKSFEASRKAIP